jgi:hypothetical protein
MLVQRDIASPRGRLVSSMLMNVIQDMAYWTIYSKCMILFFAEVLSTKITPLKQKVEVTEGGDAMEE